MKRYPLTVLLAINVFMVVFALPGLFLFSSPRQGQAVDVSYLQGVTVGVLDLTDLTGVGDHGSAFSALLFSELESLGVLELVAPPRLREALAAAGVKKGEQASFRQMIQAGKAVGADILVAGTINNYLMLNPHTSAISISLYAVNVHDGKTVWTDNLTRSFDNTSFVDEGARMAATLLVKRMVEGMEKEKKAMRRYAGTGRSTTASLSKPALASRIATAGSPLSQGLADSSAAASKPSSRNASGVAAPGESKGSTPSVDDMLDRLLDKSAARGAPALSKRGRVGMESVASAPSGPAHTTGRTAAAASTPASLTAIATGGKTAPVTSREDLPAQAHTDRDESVLLATVHFATGSAELDRKSRAILDGLRNTLNESPKAPVIIEGHTDDKGSRSFNSYLSHARAQAVRSYLSGKIRNPERLLTFGYGDNKPLVQGDDERSRALNRRATIRLKPGAIYVAQRSSSSHAAARNTAARKNVSPASGRLPRTAAAGVAKAAPVACRRDSSPAAHAHESQVAASYGRLPELGKKAREILAGIREARRRGSLARYTGKDASKAGSTGAATESASRMSADLNLYLERCKVKLENLHDQPIRPGDALRVKVAGHEELDKKVVVTTDGLFSYKLIDDFKVTGMSLPQLTKIVQKKLKRYVLNASVNIRRVHLVKVLGEVKSAGVREFADPPSLLEALAQAGGYKDFDASHNRYRARILTSEGAMFEIDLSRVLKTGMAGEDLKLFHGDSLVVELDESCKIYVMGAVNNAVMYYHGMRLMDALILARQTMRAPAGPAVTEEKLLNIKNVRILRRKPDGGVLKIEINVHDIIHRNLVDRNIELRPGDYVIVPRRSKRRDMLGMLKDFVSPVFSAVTLWNIF